MRPPIAQDVAAEAMAAHGTWRYRVATLLGIDLVGRDLSDGQLWDRLVDRVLGIKRPEAAAIDPAGTEHVWERVLDHANELELDRLGSPRAADLRRLLAEVEQLRRENALLRRGER